MDTSGTALAMALVICLWPGGEATGEAKKSIAPIYPVKNAIKIDGKATDWEWAPTLGKEKYAHHIVIEGYGTAADFWARYDDTFLYVTFRVHDSSPALNKRLLRDRWQGDQVELLLCTDPDNHERHHSFGEHDYQFFVGPDADGKVSVFVNQNALGRDYLVPGSQAALTVWPDKKGYDVECKILWESLNRPDYFKPEAGLEIGWQIQVDFGTPDGDNLGYAAKWHPFGIHFQNPSTWGWARLMKPNEVLFAEEPEENKSEPAGHAEITFDLPVEGLVSVNVTRDDGVVVRRVVIGEQMQEGRHTATWDGLDENGDPVAIGSYSFIGSVANLDVKYLCSMGNTSPQPYGGLHKSSGGEYRHGAWNDVIMNPDGTFYVLNDGGEGPPSMQMIDPSRKFAVAWGGTTSIVGNEFQQVGTRDDKYLYFVHSYRVTKEGKTYDGQMFSRMEAATRKSVQFAGGEWVANVVEYEGGEWEVRGIGAVGGKVFVPIFSADRIDIYDSEAGKRASSITHPGLSGPSDVWPSRDGVLLVIDRYCVHRFTTGGDYVNTPVRGLKQGWAVTEGPEGEIIVSDAATHQIKFFDRDGKLLKAMGPESGATGRGRGPVYVNDRLHDEWVGGPAAADSFFRPKGIAADAKGNLVVVDRGNVRVQYFDKSGKIGKSLTAQIYPSLVVDPQHPNPVFITGEIGVIRRYDLNWETGDHRLTGQWAPIFNAPIGTQFVKFRGNQPYFFTGGSVVYTIEDDKLRVSTQLGRGNTVAVLEDGEIAAKQKPGVTHWVWCDANADGLPQEDEYTLYSAEQAKPWWSVAYPLDYHVEDNWNIVTKVNEEPQGQVIRFLCKGFDARGNPIYSWAHAELVFDGAAIDPNWTNDLSGGKPQRLQLGGLHLRKDGTMFLVLGDRPSFIPIDCRFRRYAPGGKRLFSICTTTKGFWDKPGIEISFCTQMPTTLDDYVFITDVPGAVHVFTQEGLYAATLCEAADWAPELHERDARYRPMGENWFAHIFRHPENERVYLIAQPNAQTMTLLYQVTGLEQTRRFSGRCKLVPLAKE